MNFTSTSLHKKNKRSQNPVLCNLNKWSQNPVLCNVKKDRTSCHTRTESQEGVEWHVLSGNLKGKLSLVHQNFYDTVLSWRQTLTHNLFLLEKVWIFFFTVSNPLLSYRQTNSVNTWKLCPLFHFLKPYYHQVYLFLWFNLYWQE